MGEGKLSHGLEKGGEVNQNGKWHAWQKSKLGKKIVRVIVKKM